ncbi:GDSL-like Lipase/Acylhydrolase [Rubripirellula tenax]|uniref:GDSL-like Lipase/Acylhydrolase n=1 Tax=Rubripirellula tenax TaxID=2528015 RepID=A0A5C6FKQ3_9BACT|nr:GDSL-type esterase/lipase family protein [Rubripirellula tenax]TWU60587.1 GDSL-like Lipase/Acylhydrolase [Rubripirellula tenax]
MTKIVADDKRGRRRRVMIAMAVTLSLLPFFAIEWAVRTFATVPDAVDVDPVAGMEHLRPLFELDAESQRYVIPDWRLKFFYPDSFAQTKPAGTRRIFVLGGSTVAGRPYATETAFSTWLRLRLEAAAPEAKFEVVNCGGVSYASYRVSKLLDEVLRFEPDAIVLYTGHNEFLEDRSYAAVRELGWGRRAATRVAAHWATVGWLQRKFASHADPTNAVTLSAEVDTRLDHVGGLDAYRDDPGWRREVESQFHQTLTKMIDTTKAAGVPMIACVPAGDLINTPPFKSDTSNAHTNAMACYMIGRSRFEGGRSDEAKQLLVMARESDLCPLRATTAIVDSVRVLCKQSGVPVVDTERILDTRDFRGARVPDGIVDPQFFADHVHPTIAGHQRIADAIANQFASLGWIQIDDGAADRYEDAARRHLDSLDETYYARGDQRLAGLKRWAAGRGGSPIAEDEKPLE